MLAANTHDSLLVFTNRGRVYQLKAHEMPDAGRTAKGLPIVNILAMQPDETVATHAAGQGLRQAQFLFFTTRLGPGQADGAEPVPVGPLDRPHRDRPRAER